MDQYLLSDASLVKMEPEDIESILTEKTPPVIITYFQIRSVTLGISALNFFNVLNNNSD